MTLFSLASSAKKRVLESYSSISANANKEKQLELIKTMCLALAGKEKDSELGEARWFKPKDGLTDSQRTLYTKLVLDLGVKTFGEINSLFTDKEQIQLEGNELAIVNNFITQARSSSETYLVGSRYAELVSKIKFSTVEQLLNLQDELYAMIETNSSLIVRLDNLNQKALEQVATSENVDLLADSGMVTVVRENPAITSENFKSLISTYKEKSSEYQVKFNEGSAALNVLRSGNWVEICNNDKLKQLFPEFVSRLREAKSIEKFRQVLTRLQDSLSKKLQSYDSLNAILQNKINKLEQRKEEFSNLKDFFDYKIDDSIKSFAELAKQSNEFETLYGNIKESHENNAVIEHYANISNKIQTRLEKANIDLYKDLTSEQCKNFIADQNLEENVHTLLGNYIASLNKSADVEHRKFTISELEQLKGVISKINDQLKGIKNPSSVTKAIAARFAKLESNLNARHEEANKNQKELQQIALIGWDNQLSIKENKKIFTEQKSKFDAIKTAIDGSNYQLSKNILAAATALTKLENKISEVTKIKNELLGLKKETVDTLAGKLAELQQTYPQISEVKDLKEISSKIRERSNLTVIKSAKDIEGISIQVNETTKLINSMVKNDSFTETDVQKVKQCIDKLKELNKVSQSSFKLYSDTTLLPGILNMSAARRSLFIELKLLAKKLEKENPQDQELLGKVQGFIVEQNAILGIDNHLNNSINLSAIDEYVNFQIESFTLTKKLTQSVKQLAEQNIKVKQTVSNVIEKKQETLEKTINEINEQLKNITSEKKKLANDRKTLMKAGLYAHCQFNELLEAKHEKLKKLIQELKIGLEAFKALYDCIKTNSVQEQALIKELKQVIAVNSQEQVDSESLTNEQKIMQLITGKLMIKFALNANSNVNEKFGEYAQKYAEYLYAKIKEPETPQLEQLYTLSYEDFLNPDKKQEAEQLKAAFIAKNEEFQQLINTSKDVKGLLINENKTINEYMEVAKSIISKADVTTEEWEWINDIFLRINATLVKHSLIGKDSKILDTLGHGFEIIAPKTDSNDKYSLEDLIRIYNTVIVNLRDMITRLKNHKENSEEYKTGVNYATMTYSSYGNQEHIKAKQIPVKCKELWGKYFQGTDTTTPSKISREAIFGVKHQIIRKVFTLGLTNPEERNKMIREIFVKLNKGIDVLGKVINGKEITEIEKQILFDLFKIMVFTANDNVKNYKNISDDVVTRHINSKFKNNASFHDFVIAFFKKNKDFEINMAFLMLVCFNVRDVFTPVVTKQSENVNGIDSSIGTKFMSTLDQKSEDALNDLNNISLLLAKSEDALNDLNNISLLLASEEDSVNNGHNSNAAQTSGKGRKLFGTCPTNTAIGYMFEEDFINSAQSGTVNASMRF